VYCSTESPHTGIFSAAICTGSDNVAMELATDFNAIFFDDGLGANLHNARIDHFDAVNDFNFF
jgi:hypothetical protein